MHAIQQAKQQVLTELKKAVGKEFTPSIEDLSYPPDAKMGDLSFACFVLAKGLKRNPSEIATEIAAKIGPKGFVKSIVALGPYVNFTLDGAAFGDLVAREISEQAGAYGASSVGENKKIMVEYAQPNTHKEIHVGHLRNFMVGQTLVDVLRTNGYDVIPTSYINDLGANVARCVWAVRNVAGGVVPEGEDPMSFLQRMYVEATARGEADQKVKEEVSAIQRDLEDGKGPLLSTWKKTWKWSVAYIKSVFKELGLPIDVWYFESDLIGDAKRTIEDLIERGIVTSSQGAWIVDLESEGLGANLLVKSDGTLLYNAKDIVLALRKEEDYHPARSLYVIDARQSLAMQQLFATLKRMGFSKELQHVSYEFVTLKEGAMSSRKGNVIRYETFRDEMLAIAAKETASRHAEWDQKKVSKVARAVAFSAIRFGMLKQDLDRKIVFDPKEAMSFDGFTGPYLLYSFARMQSILKKAKGTKKGKEARKAIAMLPVERRLLLALAKYPEIVFTAGQTLRLSPVPQYLFELSKTFSEFYDQAPVLSAAPELAAFRLRLVVSTAQVLENGLNLLGIEPILEM
ncbi:arginine--tRNA ligase [Candidatus Uhrbacteria bacterium RIFOXYB12_FULL_58_10]|uniref:Arginine--tRNA ligase n=1 Tax=Candidatus Uhrbacteria bacterium RIFOXYB2_FULL_57_15 TaxID=1802422 RepID=A0A1F7WB19_9BACT|nr:MAG: arginine--tRNA ligase [Candidatus Uhrbacteria bacterium RIFOXYB12_FULL_58_10]OGL99284.1 MAG: arginine--tRNA ligase [Candidatus Uhrbacteria bacterium RIFOXYB2_FULL_57_15]OGL99937.1 MAG: arginine--tRNA ligase [Candidatus Uhrbacteria bacterium RIFOXYC12_FULL_57_11]